MEVTQIKTQLFMAALGIKLLFTTGAMIHRNNWFELRANLIEATVWYCSSSTIGWTVHSVSKEIIWLASVC